MRPRVTFPGFALLLETMPFVLGCSNLYIGTASTRTRCYTSSRGNNREWEQGGAVVNNVGFVILGQESKR